MLVLIPEKMKWYMYTWINNNGGYTSIIIS